jgi:hypothetical protein
MFRLIWPSSGGEIVEFAAHSNAVSLSFCCYFWLCELYVVAFVLFGLLIAVALIVLLGREFCCVLVGHYIQHQSPEIQQSVNLKMAI